MISASVVLYHGDEAFEELLKRGVFSRIVSVVYVVDNTCGRFSHLARYKEVFYINPGRNIGFGRGHNIALTNSLKKGKRYHLLLNPDVSFEPEVLEALIDFMEENPDVGLVTPKVCYPDGSLQYHCRLLPTPWHLFARRFLGKDRNDEVYELRFTGYSNVMDVPFVLACFWLLRIDVLKSVGLFDERFFLYMEDVDLCRRIYRQARLVFYPHVKAIHEHRRGSYKSRRLLFHHIASAVKYFNKWGWHRDKERDRINREVLTKLGFFSL